MQVFPPDFKWIRELRTALQMSTMESITDTVQVEEDTKGGIRIYYQVVEPFSKEMEKAARSLIRSHIGTGFVLHSVSFFSTYICVLVYKKREKKVGRKR